MPEVQPGCRRRGGGAVAAGIEYELEKVTDIEKIMDFGVMMTPALAIDGEVKVVGKVPSVEEIRRMLV